MRDPVEWLEVGKGSDAGFCDDGTTYSVKKSDAEVAIAVVNLIEPARDVVRVSEM